LAGAAAFGGSGPDSAPQMMQAASSCETIQITNFGNFAVDIRHTLTTRILLQ
jgi:nucleoid DNA-binding protein